MTTGPLKRILCVEDHRDTCEMLQLVLSGYDFTSVSSVQNARAQIESQRYDLYILDNWLPDGSGLELCSLIRRTDPGVPILFTSAAGYRTDIESAMATGANQYVVKPYEPLVLERIVNDLLKN